MANKIEAMRVIGFPGRYVQGPGALDVLGELVVELGCTHPVVVSDDIVQSALGSMVPDSLQRVSLPVERLRFGGECTYAAIAAHASQARDLGADLVIALGGGKTIDTAKGIARTLGLRLIIAPTVASNDSPTSRLIVVYDDHHRLVGVEYLGRNPDMVVVDTRVIVRAPVRFFRAGIGDAISKRFEAAQCGAAGGRNFFGGLPPDTARVMADRCYDVIQDLGEASLADVARHECTGAVESVTEATVLLSGLGFESGGLSLSHALLRGLTAIPSLSSALHGEMVAFGTLVQLVLEERSAAEIREHVELLIRLDLPTTIGGLGQDRLSAHELTRVSELTLKAPYIGNFQRSLTSNELERAITQADSLGAAPAHCSAASAAAIPASRYAPK